MAPVQFLALDLNVGHRIGVPWASLSVTLCGRMISGRLAALRGRRLAAVLTRERVALVLAGVVVIAAVAIAHSQTGAKPAPAQRTIRLGGDNLPSTNALVDSIGVVVHFNYVDTAYRNRAAIVRLLGELG